MAIGRPSSAARLGHLEQALVHPAAGRDVAQRAADAHAVAAHRVAGLGRSTSATLWPCGTWSFSTRPSAQRGAGRQAAVVGDDRDVVAIVHADEQRVHDHVIQGLTLPSLTTFAHFASSAAAEVGELRGRVGVVVQAQAIRAWPSPRAVARIFSISAFSRCDDRPPACRPARRSPASAPRRSRRCRPPASVGTSGSTLLRLRRGDRQRAHLAATGRAAAPPVAVSKLIGIWPPITSCTAGALPL